MSFTTETEDGWDIDDECVVCNSKGDAPSMLLCDGCDAAYHMYCLPKPIEEVPEGDWYCHGCLKEQAKETRAKEASQTKECQMCGDEGQPELLEECKSCHRRYAHSYCMSPIIAEASKLAGYKCSDCTPGISGANARPAPPAEPPAHPKSHAQTQASARDDSSQLGPKRHGAKGQLPQKKHQRPTSGTSGHVSAPHVQRQPDAAPPPKSKANHTPARPSVIDDLISTIQDQMPTEPQDEPEPEEDGPDALRRRDDLRIDLKRARMKRLEAHQTRLPRFLDTGAVWIGKFALEGADACEVYVKLPRLITFQGGSATGSTSNPIKWTSQQLTINAEHLVRDFFPAKALDFRLDRGFDGWLQWEDPFAVMRVVPVTHDARSVIEHKILPTLSTCAPFAAKLELEREGCELRVAHDEHLPAALAAKINLADSFSSTQGCLWVFARYNPLECREHKPPPRTAAPTKTILKKSSSCTAASEVSKPGSLAGVRFAVLGKERMSENERNNLQANMYLLHRLGARFQRSPDPQNTDVVVLVSYEGLDHKNNDIPMLLTSHQVAFVDTTHYLTVCAREEKLVNPHSLGMEAFADGIMVVLNQEPLLRDDRVLERLASLLAQHAAAAASYASKRKQTYAPDEALTTAARNFALPGSKVYLQDHAAGNRASNQVINGADNGAGSFGGHSTAIVVSDAGTERGATSAGRSLSARASVAGEGSDMELDCDDDEGALAPPTHGVYQMRYLAEDLELFRARCLQAMDLEERSSAGYRRAKAVIDFIERDERVNAGKKKRWTRALQPEEISSSRVDYAFQTVRNAVKTACVNSKTCRMVWYLSNDMNALHSAQSQGLILQGSCRDFEAFVLSELERFRRLENKLGQGSIEQKRSHHKNIKFRGDCLELSD